jgi:hypothetical protein
VGSSVSGAAISIITSFWHIKTAAAQSLKKSDS